MRIVINLACQFCGRRYAIHVERIPDTAVCPHCKEKNTL